MKRNGPPRTDGHCSDCGQPIPNYLCNPGGIGYVSPKSDDLPGSIKEAMIFNMKAYEAIPRPVCMACYVIAFEDVYPGEQCPLKETSDFIHSDLDRAYRLGLLLSQPTVIQAPLGEAEAR